MVCSFFSGISFGMGFGVGILTLGLGFALLEDYLQTKSHSCPKCHLSKLHKSETSENLGSLSQQFESDLTEIEAIAKEIELRNAQEIPLIKLEENEIELTLAANNNEEEKMSS